MVDRALRRHRHDLGAHARPARAAAARAGHHDLAVLDRIRNVPRHIFVDEALGSRAYEDTALPIGFGQTISQPYIVARMTEALLEGGAVDNVLEIGTGCGYQTAVLAPLVGTLYTIERIEPLTERAKQRAEGARDPQRALPARRRHRSAGRSQAPFDGIIVAAAPLTVPEALLRAARARRPADRARGARGRAAADALHAAREQTYRPRVARVRSRSCRCSAASLDFNYPPQVTEITQPLVRLELPHAA